LLISTMPILDINNAIVDINNYMQINATVLKIQRLVNGVIAWGCTEIVAKA